MRLNLALISAAALLTSACSSTEPDYLKSIGADALRQLTQSQDIFLVDVHTPQQKHIKGTDAFVPYDAVAQHLAQFPADKSTPIYLYCESGRMATTAAKVLHDQGYTQLFNLQGGEKEWRKRGFELE